MNRRISRAFNPHPKASASARAALDASAEIFSDVLDENRIDDLRLLMSELVTNSVRHGGPQRAPIKLQIEVTSTSVRVKVQDAGRGFDTTPKPIRPDDDQGWGLFLLDQLADRWGISQDGTTTVWFELDRRV
ncbi:MAG: ATP-binding protein [Actinomycetota bacterium]